MVRRGQEEKVDEEETENESGARGKRGIGHVEGEDGQQKGGRKRGGQRREEEADRNVFVPHDESGPRA